MQHEVIEKNISIMIVLIIFAISFGGLVEIVPLFFQDETNKPHEGLKPLTALEFEGRDVYIREGCNVCHTQMIRPLHAETQRYGHFSLASEDVYEHPFLWGSKRTGPDVARIGGRYSDEWHRVHLFNPRDVVPESIMPAYPWLRTTMLDGKNTATKMRAFQKMGVPYTEEDILTAADDLTGKTEEDATVAYLQHLGLAIKNKR